MDILALDSTPKRFELKSHIKHSHVMTATFNIWRVPDEPELMWTSQDRNGIVTVQSYRMLFKNIYFKAHEHLRGH